MTYRLILGNKTYSSWSLRGWLLFEAFGIAFEEEVIPLFTPAFDRFRQERAPARTVPALVVEEATGSQLLWDSLAIAEFLHERHPEAGLWPADPGARAGARCLAAEMHSGFAALRGELPMNLRRPHAAVQLSPEAEADIARVTTLWHWAKAAWGGDGPYLFGQDFTAADAFFVPVASRFQTYGIALDDFGTGYASALLDHLATRQFAKDASTEDWVIEAVERAVD